MLSTFTLIRGTLAALVLAVVVGSAALAPTPGRAPRSAEADVTPPLIGIQTWVCLALTTGLAAGGCIDMENDGELQKLDARRAGLTPTELLARSSLDGGVTPEVQVGDFLGMDLDKNQQHENDSLGFWMMAFVTSDAPVTFSTTKGVFAVGGVPTSAFVVCGPGQALEEPDCDNNGVRGDGVVIAKFVPNGAPRGSGTVTARQGFIEQKLDFTIVGEPSALDLALFEKVIQTTNAPIVASTLTTAVAARTATLTLGSDILAGRTLPADIVIEPAAVGTRREVVTVISKTGTTYQLETGKLNSQQGDPILPEDLPFTIGEIRENGTIFSHPAGVAVATASTCTFPSSAAGFADALAAPDKTIMFARTLDSDGVSIANSLVRFVSSDSNVLTVASPIVPGLDLGAFGVGGPMVICGGSKPGKATLRFEIMRTAPGVAVVPDPNAPVTVIGGVETAVVATSTEYTVVGPPASITLTATPASVECNGTNTSTVEVQVKDAADSDAADGVKVNFSVVTLGTASPLTASLGGGKASTTVTPLSGSTQGVPVIATVGDLTASILVSCTPGGAAPGAAPAPGGAGAPAGTITGPDTGFGPTAPGTGALSWWPALALAAGALGLATGGLAWRRRPVR